MAKQPQIDEKTARELLAKERDRIETSLSDLKRLRRGEHQDAAEETDQADRGERIEEDGVDGALEDKLSSELQAVERAEQRLEDGSFGLSVLSGEPIPAARLKAIPWAERTADEER
jgi:DnaK suppressor protein